MKKNSVSRTILIGAIIFAAEFILACIFLGVYSGSNSRIYTQLQLNQANNEVRGSAEEFANDIKSVRDYMSMALSVTEGNEDTLKSAHFLEGIESIDGVEKAVYLDENNMAYAADGSVYDLSDKPYVADVRMGKPAYTSDSGIDEKNCFVLAVDTAEGTSGKVLALVDTAVFDENVGGDNGFHYSFYVLLGPDHETVYSTGRTANLFLIEGVLWDNLKKYADSQEEWAVFVDMFEKREQYVLQVNQTKTSRYIAYYPVEGTDWVFLTGYDKKYIESCVVGYVTPGRVLIGQIIAVIIVMVITFVIVTLIIRNRSFTSSKELTGKAETDLLTGVYNKLATEAKIREYIATNVDGQGVLILIDVDNFKKVNDTMGHAFGDEVLRNLGLRLKTLYRATDIIGRIGGDEFIVFLKDIHDMGIIEREARKLEVFFRDFEVGEYTKYSVNASLGATIYPMDGTDFETLYKNADSALYYVKHNGKNRLTFYKEDEKFFKDE